MHTSPDLLALVPAVLVFFFAAPFAIKNSLPSNLMAVVVPLVAGMFLLHEGTMGTRELEELLWFEGQLLMIVSVLLLVLSGISATIRDKRSQRPISG